MATEQELKFAAGHLPDLRDRLKRLGARLVAPSTWERNWVLDDADGTFRRRGCLVRVRQWGERHLVTFKGPAQFRGALKVREELEVQVDASDRALALLAALGLVPVFYYEKQRETWEVGPTTVALDCTPMGEFVELEGEPDAVSALAAALGFELRNALRGSYLELWREYRKHHPEAPEHMVFP